VKRFIEDYNGQSFDLIIIGGGITGAAAAYDAASRGLKVALLEKKDFGWATSAATSKLIHGGLRYLNYLRFGLVRESLRERRILENIAPNFVYPFPFMIPNYRGIKNNKWVIKAGMILYDMLSIDKGCTWDMAKKIPFHRSLSREDVLREEPGLLKNGLTGAAIYYDCLSICPERLTLAFVKSAVKYGAQVANYAEVKDCVYGEGQSIVGVKALDLTTGKEVAIKGTLTIDCGGPWTDIILNTATQAYTKHSIRRSEGIHIITKPLVNRYAVVLMTPNGRHFFIIPWRGHSLIGTTDKEYKGNPDEYRVTRASIEEFLREINESLGRKPLTYGDVLFAYGGLRPLVEDQVEGTYESTRKYEIFDGEKDGFKGLIAVEGGKYTTSRNLAVNVLKLVEKKLGRNLPKVITDRAYLCGCEIEDIEAFFAEIQNEHPEFDKKTLDYLGRNYGTDYRKVLAIAREDEELPTPVTHDGEILAEVIYAAREEMALTLKDILFRRTGIGTLGNPGDNIVERAGDLAAKELGWDTDRLVKELEEANRALSLPE
jgi:glycerol-3-phosphate dehydrogenase